MIEEIFSDGGALAAALRRTGKPSRMRVPQRQYATHINGAIKAGQPVFADAETGVGKTLGYLIPVMLRAFSAKAGRPLVVVSTATVALQRQILSEDIPTAFAVVKDILGVTLSAEARVGREQIIDPEHLETAIRELAHADEMALAADISEWVANRIGARQLPLRSELMETFADRIVAYKPWLSPHVIGFDGNGASEVGELYDELLQRCDEANVLVVNHHLLALNMLRPFLWDTDRAIHLVVDEADRLPSVVESINRRMVPLHLLSGMIGAFPGGDAAKEAVASLSEEVMTHFDHAWTATGGGVAPISRLDRREKGAIVVKMKGAVSSLDQMLARLHQQGHGRSLESRERLTRIEHTRTELAALAVELENPHGNALLYYSPVRHYPGIASINSGSARLIARKLWTDSPFRMESLVFTSATLGTMASQSGDSDVKRALTPFISECGFKITEIPATSCAVIAPNRFGTMSFVRPPLDAQTPFASTDDDADEAILRPEAVELWGRMIRAAAAEGGRTLVLVPSYRDISALAAHLGNMDGQLIAQRSGLPTNAAIELFLSRPDTVWLSAAAWEGVSLPGAIAHIVIPRFPIRPTALEDTLIERYFEDIGAGAKGRSVVFGRKMAETRRRLRQGIGRGIRSAEDSVKVWFGDARWPLTQDEMDSDLRDQPTTWSSTMLNAVPKRFRKNLESSPRFQ